MNWHAAGVAATPQTPLREPSHAARKARAVAAYASQLPLFSGAQLADLSAPERYWRDGLLRIALKRARSASGLRLLEQHADHHQGQQAEIDARMHPVGDAPGQRGGKADAGQGAER